MNRLFLTCAIALVAFSPASAAETKKSAKEALQAFNDLIGSWKCTGEPMTGSRDEKDKGFWQEKIAWQWQFKDKDIWLLADLTKGKYYTKFELRYVPDGDRYQLKATTTDKQERTFAGKLEKSTLTVERTDEKTKQGQRIVFALNHSNRHVCYLEEKAPTSRTYTRLFRIGCTKEGVPFASVDKGPECIVSGGLGTMPVTFKGKTYYVCCSGCRVAFNDEPEKYIKEWEDAQKKKKKD